MNRLIQTFKNIWSIPELKQRLLYTLALLFVFRVGTFILLPGVNAQVLANMAAQSAGRTDLLGLLNTFTGGAFAKGAIFALGVMPYITASIIIQLLTFAVPYFQRLQQHEGESGRKKLNQMTRFLTIGVTMVQGSGYLTYLTTQNAIAPGLSAALFWFSGIVILTAGTVFAMWLGERITEKGLGNGTSFIIMSGIIDQFPQSIAAEFQLQSGFSFVIEMAIWCAIVLGIIVVIQAVRRIPLQFAKRMVGRTGTQVPAAGNRDYLPIKLNAAGVMPIIFAQAMMFIPSTIAQFMSGQGNPTGFLAQLNDYTSLPHNLLYFVLVVVFTYVYTALIVNPRQYAEYLKRQNAFIPGVKPGENTAEFIDSVTTRITLPGAIILGLISILPGIAAFFGINSGFARFFGGTSVLIMIGVILDTLTQIQSYLLLSKYDGLIKGGKIEGRGGLVTVGEGGI
ncbi:MAG: preprotein translocase subunit SecY [Saprospiraceae bacterium]|nr:preprotein translocase subunit SecY [Saprospiraceae bacterium]